MKPTYLALCITGAVACSSVDASPLTLELESGFGFDDNPFRLNNSFNPQEDTFWLNDIEAKLDATQHLSISLGLRDQRYQDNDDADSQRIKGSIRYQREYKDCNCKIDASVNYRNIDRTYISRFTGVRFAFGGQDASDRYDFSEVRPDFTFTYQFNKQHSVSTNLRMVDREYENYTSIGLPNLDFREFRNRTQWEYTPTKTSRYQIFAEYRYREYDDRLAVDANGDDILDVISEYDHWKLGLRTRFKLAKGQWFYANVDYQDRTDNGEGFFDTETTQLYLRYYARLSKTTKLDISARYTDLNYPRGQQAQDVENQDETPSSQGWYYRAHIETQLYTFADTPLIGYVTANYSDVSADLNVYEFDRARLTAGIKIQF